MSIFQIDRTILKHLAYSQCYVKLEKVSFREGVEHSEVNWEHCCLHACCLDKGHDTSYVPVHFDVCW